MSVLDRIALSAAEAAGRNLGPRAGLVALRALIDGLDDRADRARAVLGALRHAITLRDEQAYEWLLGRWMMQGPSTSAFHSVAAVCGELLKAGRTEEARRLADAECARTVDAGRAFYLRARCTPDDHLEAATDLRLALRYARKAPRDAELENAAAARLARITLEKPKPALDLVTLNSHQRLAVLASMLHAKGRYGRVAALDGLMELASGDVPDVANAAIRLCARHADADGRLTEIEIDRIRSAIAHWADEEARAIALSRLEAQRTMMVGEGEPSPEHAQAVALLHGAELEAPSGAPNAHWRSLDAIVALRKAKADRGDRLDALVATLDAERPRISLPLLTVAWLACCDDAADVRVTGFRIASRLLELNGARPARGWVRLAASVDDPGLAERLLRVGADVHEPEAAERLAEQSVRSAWHAWETGDHRAARELLRAAKRLHAG